MGGGELGWLFLFCDLFYTNFADLVSMATPMSGMKRLMALPLKGGNWPHLRFQFNLMIYLKRVLMAVEQTLSIIKPDAIAKNVAGKIINQFEEAGLRVVAARMMHLSRSEAEGFYAVHKERPFFGELCDFMMSGPVMVMVLEGEGAIMKNREVMGATNPADAAPGTIRAQFADSIGENAVHGSDAAETAKTEIAFFFPNGGVCPRTR